MVSIHPDQGGSVHALAAAAGCVALLVDIQADSLYYNLLSSNA